ncbi:hypothetical protein BZA77DRAFT_343890 [Pyronema omphalodes]|nr:hypothetical protein BZA77DRAFT_343890 [Pyronema omphalodes]
MDPVTTVGLGLAVPGMLDILIKACLKGYEFISIACSADKDFETHKYQFTIEQQRLKDLTTIITKRVQNPTIETDDVRFRLICSTLIRIAQQFSDFKRLESQYGVRVSSSDQSATKPRKRSSIRKLLGWRKSRKDTKRESDALKTVLSLMDLQLDNNLKIATMKTLESPLTSVVSTYSRLRWACLDSKKVKTLISKLQQYNSNMQHLVDGLNNEHGVRMTTVNAEIATHKPHFMVPFPKNGNFIGKSHISSWFKNYHQKQFHFRLALCGLGGIGKTQDVLSFVYEYQNKQPVFWIHAGSIAQFDADCQKLASLAQIPGHDDTTQNPGSIVKKWLESPESGDWILVLDNADNMLDFYPTASNNAASKERENGSIAHGGIAEFVPRGPKDAPDDTNTSLRRLLKELQYLPLAITQVAAYLDLNRSISTSDYLKMFENKKESNKLKRILSKPHDNIWRDNGGNAETILTTFSISFRQLQEQSKLADSFLRFMACIDRKSIPRDLLFQIHLDGVDDDILIADALDKLVNFSILQHANVDFGSGKGYEIHSLVHLAIQTYLESSEIDASLNNASVILANTLPDSGYENWSAWRVYLPHVISLLEKVGEDSEASADLCMKAGDYLYEAFGRYSESLKLYERARKLYASFLGEESTKTLMAMYYVGRLKEAHELGENVLDTRRRTLGGDHPDSLRSMKSLDTTYSEMDGRVEEVPELDENGLEVSRYTVGEEHPNTPSATTNLAATDSEMGGRSTEVPELDENGLEVSRRTVGEEHPDIPSAMTNLAATDSEMGESTTDAQELAEKVPGVSMESSGVTRTYYSSAPGLWAMFCRLFCVSGRWI